MKIAAIDQGSNSIHLVIVEVSPSGGFQVVASEKDVVVSERADVLRIQAEARGDCELELWGVGGRTALLEEMLERRVRVEAGPVASPRRALLRA